MSRLAGGWRVLSGDETGVLLGDHLLRCGGYTDPLVATTVVSSSMLRSVASAYGARYAETLTGFKWIVRGGPGLVYGYEEALGYCVDPDAVRDKDGIAAAVLACDLAATRAQPASRGISVRESAYECARIPRLARTNPPTRGGGGQRRVRSLASARRPVRCAEASQNSAPAASPTTPCG